MAGTDASGTTITYGKAYDDAEAELKRHIPPWREADFAQRCFTMLIYTGVWFPVIVLLCIVFISYSVYVTFYIYPLIDDTGDDAELYYWHSDEERDGARTRGIIFLSIMTYCLVLFLVSHWMAITTPPGRIPQDPIWDIPSEDSSESDNSEGKQKETRKDGSKRSCGRCQKRKPDRAHHCKQCEHCNLKMDHHCNWIANCVGYFNYKYFFLMVFYGAIMLLLFIGSFWECVVVTLNNEDNSTSLCFLVLIVYSLLFMLSVAVVGFLYFHVWLIWHNFSTIEFCEKRKLKNQRYQESPFSKSLLSNFKEALGENPYTWLFPCKYRKSSDSGTSF